MSLVYVNDLVSQSAPKIKKPTNRWALVFLLAEIKFEMSGGLDKNNKYRDWSDSQGCKILQIQANQYAFQG